MWGCGCREGVEVWGWGCRGVGVWIYNVEVWGVGVEVWVCG